MIQQTWDRWGEAGTELEGIAYKVGLGELRGNLIDPV
jgi:hypothetical protein